VLGLGVIDYTTGYDLNFFVFYCLPIAGVAARHGRTGGYAVSLLCAGTWIAVDWLTGYLYAWPWIGVWNAAVRLAAFAVVAHTIGRIRALLAAAHHEVQTRRGFLPICAQSKKIRTDQGYWQEVETYLAQHAPVAFTHGPCDECAAAMLRELREAGPAAPQTAPGRPLGVWRASWVVRLLAGTGTG